ncbi:MAG: DnaJ domain-containing protein [Alphaproteobacteria bacterium]|jgi:DnaJ like chaperone protein|nr:DnaJ domain-containing protein [Alphaproteobacteria bacterium]
MIKKIIGKIKEINQQINTTSAIVSLSAKVARAGDDDLFLKKKVFFDIFKSKKEEIGNVERIFDLSSKEIKGFDLHAKVLYKKFKKYPEVLEELLSAFIQIAKANGKLSDEALEEIRSVAKIFQIDNSSFLRICNINNVYDLSNPYFILGVNEGVSKEELKLRYHYLVKKYHPDHLIACGMPAEMISLLEKKMAEINKAYELIKEKKK